MNLTTGNIQLQQNKSKHNICLLYAIYIYCWLNYKEYPQICDIGYLWWIRLHMHTNICILEYEATWYFSLNIIDLSFHQWTWKYNSFLTETATKISIYVNHFWSIVNLVRSFQFELNIHKCIINACLFHLHVMNMPYALWSIGIERMITIAKWKWIQFEINKIYSYKQWPEHFCCNVM